MAPTCKLLILVTFVCLAHSANVLNKVLVDDPGALCLDGTKAAYYIHHADPNKFVLSF